MSDNKSDKPEKASEAKSDSGEVKNDQTSLPLDGSLQSTSAKEQQNASKDSLNPEATTSSHDESLEQLAKELESAKNTMKAEPTTPKSSPSQQIKASKNKEPSRSGNSLTWVLGLFNLVFVCAVAAAGYFGWQHWQAFQNEQQTQLQALAQQNQIALDSRVQQLSDAEKAMKAEIQQSLAQQNAQITEQMAIIKDFQGKRPGQWLIAEANYLARLAGRKVWIERDLKTAIALLQEADARIAQLDRPSLLPVRQAIANDVQALKFASTSPETELAMQLATLVALVDELKFAQPKEYFGQTMPEVTESVDDAWLNLGVLLDWIEENIFNFETLDQPIAPYLNQTQQELLRTALSSQLQIAQLAILRGDNALFHAALKQAQNNLQKFESGHESFLAFTQSLERLVSTPEQFELPPELTSVNALMRALETQKVAGASDD